MCVLLSLFWPTFQSLIYELVDEDGCSSSFDISTRITQCAGFSSIRMYDDHDEVSHWVKSEESEDCKHVFFWIFWLEGLGIYWRYRNRYRAFWVPEKSIGIGIAQNYGYRHTLCTIFLFRRLPWQEDRGKNISSSCEHFRQSETFASICNNGSRKTIPIE